MQIQNIEDIYELSPVQQGMLFHTLYASESGVYFEQVCCTLNGNLNVSAFKQAWKQVVARHSILRTAFYWEDIDKPLQVVYKLVELPWINYDWSGLTSTEQQQQLENFLQADIQQGFEINQAPLMRCTIIHIAQDAYKFIWSYHHLLLDGWCLPIILKEVFAFYDSCNRGHNLSLVVPHPYRDYIAWLQKQDISQAEIFWRQALQGFTAPTPLVVDRVAAKNSHQKQTYYEQQLTLSAELTAALQSLARRHRLTLNTVLQAAWGLLLNRYSAEKDIVFGTTVSGRPTALSGVESMVGLFINTLPVRMHVSDETSLLSWLQDLQVQQVEREQYSYSQLVEIQAWSDVPRGMPLFESIVVFEKYPVDASLLQQNDCLKINKIEVFERNNYPLTVLVIPGQELSVQISYDSSRFDTDVIRRILGHLQTIIEGIVANPEQHLTKLPLLTQAERHQLLVEWNNTDTEYPQSQCIHELFETQVKRTPEAIAVVWESQHLTYRELNVRANELAHHLQSLGVGPEVLVGICMERSLDIIVGLLGILKAGGAYVPLDPSYPFERLSFMLEDVQPPVLLTQESLVEELPSHWAQVICLDSDWEDIAQENEENLAIQVKVDNLAYVIYTSGSTGKPKGVAVSHRAVNRLIFNTNYVDLQPDDRVAQASNASFDAATFEIWGSLLHGSRLVGITKDITLSPQKFAAHIREQKISTLFLTTALFNQLANVVPDAFQHLRHLLFGGEAVDPNSVKEVLRNGPPQRLLHVYGPTESTTFSSWHLVQDVPEGATNLPIGCPISNTQIYILDRHLQAVPIEVWGELHIGGAGLAQGYLNRPELTAEKFISNPFSDEPRTRLYKTGDLARYLPDGKIEFLGRIDNQVKIRGFRIELGEIEAVLAAHPEIRETTIIVREDQPGDKRLVAYIVPNQEPLTVSKLRHFLKEKLPDYMIPATFVLLNTMPLNPNGKIDRRALPALDQERPNLESYFVAPGTLEEEILAGIWAEVLGIEQVGINDNFFDLGGDSIRSIKVLAKAKQNGLDFSLQQLFQHPTISELASLITGDSSSCTAKIEAFSLISDEERLKLPDVEDAYPLTALQAGMVFHSEYSPDTAVYHDVISYHVKVLLDLQVLHEAIQELVNRHAVLRTSFALTGFSEPLQLVHDKVDVSLPVEHLLHLSTVEQEAAIDTWIEAEKKQYFDWTRPPLLRFQLHRRSSVTFNLTLSFHHSIFDGWSVASFVTQLFQQYLSKLNQEVSPLPPLEAIAFRDFVALERAALKSEECRQHWIQKLSDINITNLPRWPESYNSPEGESNILEVSISEKVSDGLKQLANVARVPLKSVLLAAHIRVLSLLSNQQDVVTGLVSNGRSEEIDGERVLGLFLNTLPFRLKLRGGTWIDLVQETFKAERESLPFRRYPLIELQKHLGGQPLFETAFNFVHFHVYQDISRLQDLEFLGAKFFEKTNFILTADFSLDIFTSEVKLSLKSDNEGLCEEQIKAIGGYYAKTLAAMASFSSEQYQHCSVLSKLEQQKLLVEWNNTQTEYVQSKCIHQLFESCVEQIPEAVAVEWENQHLTYRELNARANQLAHHLQALGVGPEVLVGLYVERSIEMIVGLLGILKSGGVYMPLDPAYPKDRLSYMLLDSQVSVLLTQEKLLTEFPEHRALVVCLNTNWEVISQKSEDNPTSDIKSSDLAYVIYTSGSTGKPKGVLISHGSLANHCCTVQKEYEINWNDCILQFASLNFDVSLEQIFPTLIAGAKLILRGSDIWTTTNFHQKISDFGLTVVDLPLAYWQQLVQEWVKTPDLSPNKQLRLVIVGGDQMLLSDLNLWRQSPMSSVHLINAYGPTEATITASIFKITPQFDEDTTLKRIPVGRPLANRTVYILDSHFQPVPIGVRGELYIGGDCLAQGYLNRPDLSAEKFIPNPFSNEPNARLYKTGDLARYLPDGNIEYFDRLDNQVKIRGFRIELGEIEAVLVQHPNVLQTTVIVKEERDGDKYIVAYVVPSQEQVPTTMTLRHFLQKKLPDYMMPHDFVMLEALPLTPNGKVDRRVLPVLDISHKSLEASFVPPRTLTEEILVAIWSEILGLEKVGIYNNFFDLGGHSLRATQLVSRVREAFGVNLPLRSLFEEPTVAGLAEQIENFRWMVEEMKTPPDLTSNTQEMGEI